ncbi:MAG TPA: DUF192 domain-containing protein, partial [Candidatus Paceibacterota bacterium]|nr:DUF192 domain-containing protein [Candidatus Paceibacterota bacterium]
EFLIIVLLSVILLLIFIIILFYFCPENQDQVCFEDNCFIVELAVTPREQARGLMFRESLDLDKGMLFIFKNGEESSFWMKNTLMALDIIWINENKEVIFISKNAQPCTSVPCSIINPGIKTRYVLELNGGITDKIGLEVGDKVIFNKEF